MPEVTEERLLSRAVMRYAMTRFERLAAEVAAQIQTYPTCDMFDDHGGAKSLWDQYSYDQQSGPSPELAMAWLDLITPHAEDVVTKLDRTEAVLLTFYCCWDQLDDPCEVVGDPPVGIFEGALVSAVMNEVARMALDHELPGEDGDHDDDWSDDDDDDGPDDV
ncbi:MAG: hypothetical protein KGQ75_14405 [Sphingomonadales bacterium]|nr:hypothetical protein [Sphingomonadales bacterium]